MASEPIGPYQIPKLLKDEPVATVSHSESLAVAINNGLGVVAGAAAAEVDAVEASIAALGPAWAPTRSLPGNADLNNYSIAPGLWRIRTPDTATILNLPPGMRSAGSLQNVVGDDASDIIRSQVVTEQGTSARTQWRTTVPGGWGPWKPVGTSGDPITEWHVFLAAGQSNMSGRGLVSATVGGKYVHTSIAQYGFKRRVLETATVPLDMHDTASGLSPATVFARNYLRGMPPHVGVLVVPAAHGGTGFTNSTTSLTWTPGVSADPANDLAAVAVQQTRDAIAAAKAAGAVVDLKGVLWHQGENNGSLSTAGYAAALDNLIGYFRTQLDSAFLPFVVGQMVPEGIIANSPGRANTDLAHQQTPGRVIYTGFAEATLGGHNPGDTTHMSKVGVDYIGRTYLDAYHRALANDGTEGVLPDNVAELDGSGKLPAVYFPDSIKPTTNGATPVGKGELLVNVDDYRLAGETTDGPAIGRAHTANKAVFFPRGKSHDSGFYENLYSGLYQNAVGPRIMAGTSAAPIQDAEPILWAQKYSSANRSTNPTEWDQGAIYGALHKQAGNAYGAAISGYVRHSSADGGQMIGVHGRGYAKLAESQVWGGWSYAWSPVGIVPHTVIGHEINIVNRGEDQGWKAGGGTGQHRGLVIVTADGSNPVTQGMFIGANSAAPNGLIHTGLKIEGAGIVASDAAISASSVANNELIQLEGAGSTSASTGVRFRGGWFRTGMSFTEASFANNAAILLGDTHRIVFGSGPGSNRYIGYDTSSTAVNFSNMNIAINGTKVLGPRRTGWGVATGTTSKAAFATYTAPTVSAAYTQAEVQAIANHLQVLSRNLAATQNDLIALGPFGA
ncbi:sialate O-acetylesterase [Arthrobacter agilis]|uniref:sialate O-acetylesterase n=1 Tax=Arthrobacter agilis TaxID=37921 RepID=UPI0023662E19|nr:sialate O-acetylesterase [Arthrobacter agilis]WDF34539.1 sialate O-acetylesterase [Arthrobacter agilis]